MARCGSAGFGPAARGAVVITGTCLALAAVCAGEAWAVSRFGVSGLGDSLKLGAVAAVSWGLLPVALSGWDARRTGQEVERFNGWALAHPTGLGSCQPGCPWCSGPTPAATTVGGPTPRVDVTVADVPAGALPAGNRSASRSGGWAA